MWAPDDLQGVAVVIATFNGARWIEPCLRSLADQGVQKIIVVDNGSTDNTVAKIGESFPEVVIIAPSSPPTLDPL